MGSKIRAIGILAIAGVLICMTSGVANDWLSQTMPRHQVVQLPLMFASGVLLALAFPRAAIRDAAWELAAFIFVMGSLIFWMLPRSIDWAVIDAAFNRVMHANMAAAGFLCVAAMRHAPLEMRIAFLGMIAAMLLATGLALRSFDILLCSSFTVSQQHETGFWLAGIGLTLLIATAGGFIRSLRRQPKHPIHVEGKS